MVTVFKIMFYYLYFKRNGYRNSAHTNACPYTRTKQLAIK